MNLSLSTPLRSAFAAIVALVLLSAAQPSRADMYKCAGSGNQPVYQDSPCPAGRELRNFQTDPATVSVVPFDLTPPLIPAPAPAGKSTRSNAGDGAADTAGNGHPPRAARARAKAAAPEGDAAERRFLHRGMSEAEVVARIGAPDMKSGSAGRRGGGARWSYLPAAGDPGMITTLHFDAGTVTQIDRKPVR